MYYAVPADRLGCRLFMVVAGSDAMYLRRVVCGEHVYLDLV